MNLDALQNASQSLIDAVQFQVEKDLALIGFEFQQTHYPHLAAMLPELSQALEQAGQEKPDRLLKAVVRVDLNSNQWKKAQNMPGLRADNQAKAILLRCFQKVYSRQQRAS
ncbi:MAG: hypothetical protein ACO3DK_02940 [Bacteroidia bacterium]